MTDKEKIKAEIERRIDTLPTLNPKTKEGEDATLLYGIYMSLLNFIDSMQEENLSNIESNGKDCKEEPASKELEDGIQKAFVYCEEHGDDFRSDCQIETSFRKGFSLAANWQKQQMMKGAVDGVCSLAFPDGTGAVRTTSNFKTNGLKCGDKVKLLILKEK